MGCADKRVQNAQEEEIFGPLDREEKEIGETGVEVCKERSVYRQEPVQEGTGHEQER
jgi:hypothetical protein